MRIEWNEPNVAKLKELWADPRNSASMIATEIGDKAARNAVIGKANRLGLSPRRVGVDLSSRPKRIRRGIKRTGMNAYEAAPVGVEVVPIVEVTEEIPAAAVKLLHLEPHHCRWPFGDPGLPEFAFCGAQRIADSPYCARHNLIAYPPRQRSTTIAQEERAAAARRERMSGVRRTFG